MGNSINDAEKKNDLIKMGDSKVLPFIVYENYIHVSLCSCESNLKDRN